MQGAAGKKGIKGVKGQKVILPGLLSSCCISFPFPTHAGFYLLITFFLLFLTFQGSVGDRGDKGQVGIYLHFYPDITKIHTRIIAVEFL